MTAFAPANTQKLLTFEEYLEEFRILPPTPQPYEILDGELIMSPSPVPIHQKILYTLGILLHPFVQSGALCVFPSPLDIVIRQSPLRTRQPDLLVISEARIKAYGGLNMFAPITIAPELVIEVLSPSETRRSLDEKIADFQEIGVQECWVVRSEDETVEVLSLTKSTTQRKALYYQSDEVQSIVFPNVKLAVDQIFS